MPQGKLKNESKLLCFPFTGERHRSFPTLIISFLSGKNGFKAKAAWSINYQQITKCIRNWNVINNLNIVFCCALKIPEHHCILSAWFSVFCFHVVSREITCYSYIGQSIACGTNFWFWHWPNMFWLTVCNSPLSNNLPNNPLPSKMRWQGLCFKVVK